MEGKVIGCVDVPGSKGLSMSNQALKHSLLSQCGIAYWVVDPLHLPHLADIRTAFLGSQTIQGAEGETLQTQLKDVSENLQAAVTRQRHSKSGQIPGSDATLREDFDIPETRNPSGWEQNSFVTPLDSRSADLSP
jgi:hypothetical protein